MKQLTFLLIAIIGVNSLFAQNEEVIFSIDGTPITVDDFKTTYLKNNANAASKESFDDYFNLFVNFKLKVHEAKKQKIDTSKLFIDEYEGYIKQLAQPYLTDVEIDDNLVNEAYQRLTQEVNASHILISIPSGNDTIGYYQKAIEIRNRIISGEPFEKVALETSNDPSVSQNKGSLGYFTAFQMVYPFESAAFNTPIGQISMPIRTQFGYHLIKVFDIRPSQGKVKIAHIMVKTPINGDEHALKEAENKIRGIHAKLVAGESFSTLAKAESEDKGTAANGGEFPWLASGQIIPDIERVAFSLPSNGSISMPFKSPFGWHIVKRIDRKMVGTKDEMLPEIKSKIAHDSRSFKSREAFISKRKAEYSYKENLANRQQFCTLVDSSIYHAKWQAPAITNNATLFTLAGKNYTQADFAKFLANNQRIAHNAPLTELINNLYNAWVNSEILSFEETQLQHKYPDFKQLQQEYLEGMLLFEITNQMVWSKSTDSAAIANYYALHADSYKWGQRVHYVVYTLPNLTDKDKFIKLLLSKKQKNFTPTNFAAFANKKLKTEVTVEQKSANTDSPEIINYKQWDNGIHSQPTINNELEITRVVQETTGDNKSIQECRGEITADLQVELEKQWISRLKQKYSIKVNNEVVNKVKSELIH